MKESLLKVLACPACKSDLNLTIQKKDSEIIEGKLTCRNCHIDYPIQNYIPRFIHSDRYVQSFSMEWTLHANTQLDSFSGTNESESTFKMKTGFDLEKLKGNLVLDVGCGSGRFMEVVSKYGAEIVGIDMSFSVDSAFRNLGLKENVHIIQADIFSLPFKESCFDNIFSIGVLHHTPNTKEAFKQLPKLLKVGGEIAIWVYSEEGFLRKIGNRISSFYRIFTKRMPRQLLYRLSYISVPLYYPKKFRILGTALNIILPTSVHPNPRWRVLDTFDWYAPKYQWKHRREEVVQWFQEEGLKNIAVLASLVSVKGER
jgi:SAM-dependent methyltransferase